MIDDTERAAPAHGTISDTGATLLAAGGLAAAFSAASCCALPMLLGSLGLASAWLGGLALLAGPYRAVLLTTAVVASSAAVCCFGAAARQSPARQARRHADGRRHAPF